MDSLTHIVLGAAIGEVVLGKKIGNRALIWGAIGETIPDLDIFGNLFLDPIDAMIFHRGFTHSILFSLIAPLIFSGLVYKLYHSGTHQSKPYKIIISILNLALIISVIWLFNWALKVDNHPRWWFLILSSAFGIYLGWRLYKYYLVKDLESPKATYGQWYLLFFIAFFTHIMLDSCTTYGTQLFLPFSDLRVAFNNIAVADPFYTIPFLLCTAVFTFLKRGSRKRAFFNGLGITISSAYMIFTIVNKYQVDQIFERALDHRHMEVSRYRATPTILNNFLWNCVAEDSSNYYVGLYSIFDTDPNLHYLNTIPKNDSIHRIYSQYPDYRTIRWFADDYLAIFPGDSVNVLSDLRYGAMQDTLKDHHDMVFNFSAHKENGTVTFTEYREPFEGNFGEVFKKFVKRVAGY